MEEQPKIKGKINFFNFINQLRSTRNEEKVRNLNTPILFTFKFSAPILPCPTFGFHIFLFAPDGAYGADGAGRGGGIRNYWLYKTDLSIHRRSVSVPHPLSPVEIKERRGREQNLGYTAIIYRGLYFQKLNPFTLKGGLGTCLDQNC